MTIFLFRIAVSNSKIHFQYTSIDTSIIWLLLFVYNSVLTTLMSIYYCHLEADKQANSKLRAQYSSFRKNGLPFPLQYGFYANKSMLLCYLDIFLIILSEKMRKIKQIYYHAVWIVSVYLLTGFWNNTMTYILVILVEAL